MVADPGEHGEEGVAGAPCPLFWLALASAAGILVARYAPASPALLAGVFILSAGLALIAGRHLRAVALGLALMAASALWFQARALSLPQDHLASKDWEEAGEAHLRLEVLEDPIVRIMKGDAAGENERRDFRARVVAWNGDAGWEPVSGLVFCRLDGSGEMAYGDVVEGRGYLVRPATPANPGQFDYAAWLRGQGILHEFRLRGEDGETVKRGGGWWIKRQAIHFKHHMRRILSVGLENQPEATGLMSAMLFGYRDGLAEPVMEAFRVTGTMHFFAVSGQNVGIILGMLVLVLRAVGLIRWRWSWMALPLVLVFCLSTGMQPSAFRAFVMATLVSVGWSIYRPVGLFNVLGGAALFMFVWDPRMLFDLGFQLSFIVLLGIAGFTPFLLRHWIRWGEPDPWIPRRLLPGWRLFLEKAWRAVGMVVCVSVAAWLGSLPHGVICFHLFAPVALLANIVVVPLASAVLALSAVSVVVGSLWSVLSWPLNLLNAHILQIMVAVIGSLAGWPGGHQFVGLPHDQPPNETVRMTVLHDRQASPVVIQLDGRSILVDPGPQSAWEYVVNPFRRWQGINAWDAVVLSNGSARRMGSARSLLDAMRVDSWMDSGWRSRSPAQHVWLEAMVERGRPKTFWRAGDKMDWPGGWEVRVLWPGKEMPWERLEDRGLVFRASSARGSVLFAGDVSAEIEREILGRGVDVRSDVLIHGEHSQAGNLSSDWLHAVRPRYLVRPGRGYQPDRSLDHVFWEDVEALGIRVLRQDRTGAVILDFGQEGLGVREFRGQ
jgi:competence protein ComEC